MNVLQQQTLDKEAVKGDVFGLLINYVFGEETGHKFKIITEERKELQFECGCTLYLGNNVWKND